MKYNDKFETLIVIASIDANWNSWRLSQIIWYLNPLPVVAEINLRLVKSDRITDRVSCGEDDMMD